MSKRHRGDPASPRHIEDLERFYRRHVDDVTRFVARRFDDPHTVADVVADVFLAVVDSGDAYRSAARNERAWLFGVARHVVSAEYRRKHRVDELTSRVAGRRLLGSDDIARLEDRLVAENDGRVLLDAMSALSERQRAVLELVVVDELSVTEAATALGITAVAARVTLHRARTRLRKAVAAPGGESPAAPLDFIGSKA
ncbi:RNA polymerase sigma factor [Streptomyces odontomachi]|uniref:RNA polymerase sigma factor n=1 Tax=Streptomyces odontomachi TaxID=2944940 RepID=UPI00210C8A75|nr:sigma-70 family RNA polymerase sigma factor [Streptomyces sp. ODS25]